MVNEKNIATSFNLVKNDIIDLQKELLNLKRQQIELQIKLERLIPKKETKPQVKNETITKIITRTPKKTYIASKKGVKFHTTNCPFAKNIKPKMKISFKSKDDALNKGYKPCNCI